MKHADIVTERLKLDPGLCEKVKQTRREIIIHLPVKMDDGGVTIFGRYRVRHNTTSDSGKERVRYHPDVNLDEVRGWPYG